MKKIFSVLGILGLIVCQTYPAYVSAANPKAPAKAASVDVDPEVKTLVELAAQGKTELLLKLLGPQTNVNRADESGTTPLAAACKGGHRDIVSALLEHGADVDAKDKRGLTPLLHAAANGHTEIVRLLLDKGARLAGPGYQWRQRADARHQSRPSRGDETVARPGYRYRLGR